MEIKTMEIQFNDILEEMGCPHLIPRFEDLSKSTDESYLERIRWRKLLKTGNVLPNL
ncbi:unnamed protein product [Phyllotreta striolata]|uniref:Uncharacterized protein n=1 Tax=Phyllotreta striolata TaxID=444603 RepID=A0A9N9XT85_PHYSR|nr:unnamed protein product [Phyllotreta striolata]